MIKQFLLAVVIILLSLCLCSISDNSLKACDTNVAACSSIIAVPAIDESIREKIEKHIPARYEEDADAVYKIFTNPFSNL